MNSDERLEKIEKCLSDLLLRVEEIEEGTRKNRSSTEFSKVETHTPATSSDQPSSVPSGHSPAADEATPTVPSAASLSSPPRPAETAPRPAPPTTPTPAPPIVLDTPPPSGVGDGVRRHDIEQLIGGKLMALVGGIIVILAGLFFAKLAYDNGWIGGIPPIVRALTLAAFGAGFLVTGEFAFRRFGRVAAIGPFLAGLGTLYIDAWVSGTILGLLDPIGALVAMGVVTVVGILVTSRSASVSIGITSIAAGAFAPYVAGGDGGPTGLGVYLTGLLVIAFVAASIRPRPFLRIRVPAFWIIMVAAVPWMFLSVDRGEVVVLVIIGSGWWFLVHAQALHMAVRGIAAKQNVGLGFASTVVFAIAIPLAVRASGTNVGGWGTLEGWIPLGLGALALAATFQVGTGLEALRPAESKSLGRSRERSIDLMSLVLWIEAGVLFFVAAGLLLEGPAIPVAWCGLGLASAYLGHRLRSRGVAVFSLIVALVGQFAATVVIFMMVGNRNVDLWFAGTGWQWSPVRDQWLSLLALAILAAVARLWPARSTVSGRSQPLGPGLAIWMGSLLFVFSMMYFAFGGSLALILVAGIPVLAASIVQHGRPDRAGWSAAYGLNLLATLIATGLLLLVVLNHQGQQTQMWSTSEVSSLGLFAGAMIPFAGLVVMMIGLARGTEDAISPFHHRIVGWASSLQFLLVGGLAAMLLLVSRETPWPLPVGNLLAAVIGISCVGATLVVISGRTPLRIARSLAAVAVVIVGGLWAVGSVLDAFFGLIPYSRSAPPLANLRFWSGVIAIVALAAVARDWPRAAAFDVDGGANRKRLAEVAGLGAIVLGLVLGSLMLLDFFGAEGVTLNPALSVLWAVYAIGLVITGFLRDIPLIRHLGLGLLGVTAFKFLLIDLGRAATIYRVVSALGVGLLMVATSMLYVRFGVQGTDKRDQSGDS